MYVPEFPDPSLTILSEFLSSEVANFTGSILDVIEKGKNNPGKVEFAGNICLLSIGNRNAKIECTIDDAEIGDSVVIKLDEFEQVVKSWIKDMEKIEHERIPCLKAWGVSKATLTDDEFAKILDFQSWVHENGEAVGYKYKQLTSPEDYFNAAPLCGIFKIEADKLWLFVHQETSAPGDNPASCLQHRTYHSLDELIQEETKRIERRRRIARKKVL